MGWNQGRENNTSELTAGPNEILIYNRCSKMFNERGSLYLLLSAAYPGRYLSCFTIGFPLDVTVVMFDY